MLMTSSTGEGVLQLEDPELEASHHQTQPCNKKEKKIEGLGRTVSEVLATRV